MPINNQTRGKPRRTANGYKLLSARAAAFALLKIKSPLILMHARPDGDTVGAGIALCEIFKALGRDPVYLCEDKIPKRLEFLVEGNTLAERTEGREVVAVDIASPEQAGKILDSLPATKLMIDHHESGKPFADGYVVGGLSSTGEAILNIAEELVRLKKIKLTKEIAYPIYAAMSSDTACFRYSSAGKRTYRKAAKLINLGIDIADINHRLFNSKSPEQVKAEGFVSTKIKTAFDGRVAYATVTLAEMRELEVGYEFFETGVDVVRSIEGVVLAFIIKETEPCEYRASLRSTKADVAHIATLLGGGGHMRAAGCSPKASNADEAADIILKLIERENTLDT